MAESNDINNADETVHFPSISTTLTGEGRTKEVRAGENVVLIDTVSYNNLIPLQTYVMKAKLVDKSTGEVLLNGNGTELVQEVTFQPPTESGTVDVTFRFDSSRVEGKTIVCFETLTRNSSTIAEHADINDAEQTVVMPKIGTTRHARMTVCWKCLPDCQRLESAPVLFQTNPMRRSKSSLICILQK
jgi:hypothetical protein